LPVAWRKFFIPPKGMLGSIPSRLFAGMATVSRLPSTSGAYCATVFGVRFVTFWRHQGMCVTFRAHSGKSQKKVVPKSRADHKVCSDTQLVGSARSNKRFRQESDSVRHLFCVNSEKKSQAVSASWALASAPLGGGRGKDLRMHNLLGANANGRPRRFAVSFC
jgi:hypothetical protein